ncbi:gliding motility protein [Streptomyces sp. SJL17-1]|uniref:gliding motility protein n=1 Tax=Streptomyces sp. SJL17-1 TaxID=2967223 RepID=UPI002966A418|nr:gliding motility protein [Streptomyces sp. SJL17-1]
MTGTDAGTETGTESPEAAAGSGVESRAGSGVGTAKAATAEPDGVDVAEVETRAVAADVVEIPKQQSAEAAADNEAGEGARK